jgi:hypothetical protein
MAALFAGLGVFAIVWLLGELLDSLDSPTHNKAFLKARKEAAIKTGSWTPPKRERWVWQPFAVLMVLLLLNELAR